jgi:branched-chain amino acid transport system ATP-binding protein
VAALLGVANLTKRFRGLTALENVNFSVEQGEIVGLIGPNGAGKTTCLNIITGYLKATAGRVIFQDSDVTNLEPHKTARHGIVRTFQQTSVFLNLSVEENVKTGSYLQIRTGLAQAVLRRPAYWRDWASAAGGVDEILARIGLQDHRHTLATNLAYGNLRRLGIAVALAARPRLLLLDEPAAGMTPTEAGGLMALIQKLRSDGITVLVVEHNMKVIMGICDRIVVLEHGRKIAEGDAHSIRHNPEVISGYLGTRVKV